MAMKLVTYHTCPDCKGEGRKDITIEFKDDPADTLNIECFTCNGEGEVDQEGYDAWVYEKNVWCKCGNPSNETRFYDDGEGKWVHKHHYVCIDCGKVVQIG